MNIKRGIGLAFIYVGAVIGAGFSSGQEIWRFIARHQIAGVYVICIIAVFFIILAPILFKLGKKSGVENYHELFYKNLPVPISYFFDLIYSCFLLGSVSVMFAGAGTLFYKLLGFPYLLGVVLTIIFVFLTLVLNREGIMTVNSILIPVLFIITIYTVISYLLNKTPLIGDEIMVGGTNRVYTDINWILDALSYGAYNLVMAVAVMTSIVYKEDKNNITVGGIIGGIILCILLVIIFIGLITAFQSTPEEEIPLLYLAKISGKGVYLAYILALYFAMITTAVANYYAFTKRFISLFKLKYEIGLVLGLIFILPLIPSGFANLVDNLYPIFGGLGLIITFFYIWIYLKLEFKSNKNL